ncbi:MAG: hypothetical protein WC389_11370 [Lutibacter sp.]|jgi:hypothetical protein
MKKLLTICFLIAISLTSKAQENKQFYIVFATQDYAAKQYLNGKQDWKPEVPYKHYVRFITTPFEAPKDLSYDNGYSSAVGNQVAEFVYKNHLALFEKLKLQNTSFNFSIREYKERDYAFDTEDCKDCNYQHEKTIIKGFKFNPKKEYTVTEYYKKMAEFITGKKFPY